MQTDLHFSSKSHEWYTPPEVFDPLHALFKFDLDVCARDAKAARLPSFFDAKADGLSRDWSGRRCWMNPPYGRGIGKWVEKASRHDVVCLLPARTDTKWFHDFVAPEATELCFMKGRVKFMQPDGTRQDAAPFPTMIVVFGFWHLSMFELRHFGWRVPFEN